MTGIIDARTGGPVGEPASEAPPRVMTGPIGWLRANLFNTWYNSVLSIVILYGLISIVPPMLDWLVFSAVWGAAPASACREASGACWAFIHEKGRLILFGLYPFAEQWRPLASVAIFLAMIFASLNRAFWKPWLIVVWLVGLTAVGILMWGGVLGLTYVSNERWGGLPLTLFLATFGLIFAFPLGILLALGRRSNLPVIRILSIVYIEVIRGVPLITILFMASVLFPLFLPTNITVDKLLRAQVALILFAAAYLAEVVRGGLQAIPKGQYEAADSLGLSYWQKTWLIILPQALRISIPPLVNTFIGFFKDTSLVIIIGLFDLLGAAKAALTDAEWRGFYLESYLFVSIIYFAFCYFMSSYSQSLERRMSAGANR